MKTMYCMMCKENRAGGDGLCVKCRFKMNTQSREATTDIDVLLPEGRYVGKAKNGIPNGRGELTYNEHDSRKSYKGDFKDGMRHGKGKLVFRNDSYYDGEWANDKYEGYGEECLFGTTFDGYFSGGAFQNGHVYFADGREYDGEWSDDQPNGMGKMYSRDGHAEEGFFVNGICAFSEAPSEEQMATFLAEQEQRALAENPIEEERESMLRKQNTSELPPEDLHDRIWNPLVKEELASAEEEESSPLLFEAMTQSPNIVKMTSQRAEPVNVSHARTVFRGNGPDDLDWNQDLEDTADAVAKRMAESAAHSIAAYDESVADVDLAAAEEAAAGNEQNKENTEMIESSFVDTSEEVQDSRNSKILQGMLDNIGKPIPEEQREKPVVKPVVSEKTLEDRAMLGYFEKLGVVAEKPAEAAETAPSKEAAAETAAAEAPKTYDPVTRTGYHTEVYANGERYEGDFVNGKRHGRGRMEYANGDVYEGEYNMGKRHGQGTMTYAAGSSYTGAWENSVKSGKGRFVQASGEVYEGDFSGGTFDGFGTYTFKNGNTFMGDWKAGKRDGKGVCVNADGTKELQIWEAGKKIFSEAVADVTPAVKAAADAENAAETVADNAAPENAAPANAPENTASAESAAANAGIPDSAAAPNYEAPAASEEREIRTINYKSGNRYEGEVDEKNLPHGKGVFIYTNGGNYEGEFSHGVRDGYGVFSWSTGDRYEGGWKNDKRHGEGVMTYANGRVRKGRFENNEYVGI